jgi:plasmid maintenance system antidote protein VapI
MWMNLQAKYDLAVAEDAAEPRIKLEVRPRTAA